MFPKLTSAFGSEARKSGWLSATSKQLLGVTLCGSLVGAFSASASSEAVLQSSVVAADKVMALIGARSPGDRPSGTTVTKLASSKASTQQSGPARPGRQAMALPKTRTRSGPPIVDVGVVPDIFEPSRPFEIASSEISPLFASLNDIVSSVPSGAGGGAALPSSPVGGGGIGVVVPPTGGGGGGTAPPPSGVEPTPPGDVVVVTPPPVSAVPEPGAWMTMILGFGAIGGQLRRRRASEQRPCPIPRVDGASTAKALPA